MQITGPINQSTDRFFTAYPEEVPEWMKNINRLPVKHMFLIRAAELGVSLNITDFRLSTDDFLHLEGNLVLPEAWVSQTTHWGFYFDREASSVWVTLSNILDKVLEQVKVGA